MEELLGPGKIEGKIYHRFCFRFLDNGEIELGRFVEDGQEVRDFDFVVLKLFGIGIYVGGQVFTPSRLRQPFSTVVSDAYSKIMAYMRANRSFMEWYLSGTGKPYKG